MNYWNTTIFHENKSRTLTNTLKRQNSAGISLPFIASKKNSKTGTYDFRDIRRVTAYAFGKRNYWRNRSGHQPCWRLRVNNDFSTCPPDKSTPQALFEVNDWLSIHFKEVGHRVVYKVAFDKILFCHHRRCNQKLNGGQIGAKIRKLSRCGYLFHLDACFVEHLRTNELLCKFISFLAWFQ